MLQGSSLIGVPLAPIDTQFLQTDSGAPGLSAEYFRGADFQGPRALERTDPAVNFTWQDRPAPGLKATSRRAWPAP